MSVPRGRLTRPGRPAEDPGGTPRRHLVVCGDDPLTYRLVDELVTGYRAEVTVIMPNRRRNQGPQISRLSMVRIVESERLDGDAFRRAQLATASGLALVQQDDVGNINAALQAQEINPGVRLVIRMFNMSLGNGIRQLFPDCAVLSDASMAAPAFVAAALGEVDPLHVRLPGRTLYVTRRADVRPQDVMCGLAAVGPPGGQPDLLPADQDSADLVLAVANGRTSALLHRLTEESANVDDQPMVTGRDTASVRVRRPNGLRARWRRRRRRPLRRLSALVSRRLRITGLVLVVLLTAATVALAQVRHTSLANAAYIALLDTLGGANPDTGNRPVQKIVEAGLTLIGIALIPVLTAAVVEAAVNARLALALGRLREPIADHVVVVGLGNVGTRVIRQLYDLGVRVVTIDRTDTARGAQVARQLDIPLIVGDASREETLRAASVQTCRALLVLSTDDVTNLEAALHGRNLQEDLRVVLRLFDGEFANRVQRAFGITVSRSVSFLAAPAFALALLEREVIGTIPVGRQVLLIAEVPVAAGSALDGASLSAANEIGEARIIAVTVHGEPTTRWSPGDRPLAAHDRLFVVATKRGLGRLLGRATAPGNPATIASEPSAS
jgi:Trk K+ transport system NAD-binding subunit